MCRATAWKHVQHIQFRYCRRKFMKPDRVLKKPIRTENEPNPRFFSKPSRDQAEL